MGSASRTKQRLEPPGSTPGAVFRSEFVEDLSFWVDTNREVALRIWDMVDAVVGGPFRGIGKPEPLKYLAAGCWSKKLTKEHRFVYHVADDRIDFLRRGTVSLPSWTTDMPFGQIVTLDLHRSGRSFPRVRPTPCLISSTYAARIPPNTTGLRHDRDYFPP